MVLRPHPPARRAPPHVLALALVLGCRMLGDPPPADGNDSGDDETAAPIDAEPDSRTEAEKLRDELALHVECLERSADRIEASWKRYADRVAEDGRPKSKKVAPYLYEIDSELEPCERAVAEAPEMPPARPDLDRAAQAYLEAASAFAVLSVDLHAYYERQGWSEDDWATSIELAPRIREAHAAWASAYGAFASALSTERHANDLALLDVVVEREGKSLRWHALHLRITADAFAACTAAGEREPCREAADAVGEAHREFQAAHAADPDADRVFWMSTYQASATELAEKTAALFATGVGKSKASSALEDARAAWARLDRDYAHLDFDFPR